MSLNKFNNMQRALLYSFITLLTATIVSIIWLAIFSEGTTALGDPYYLGEILAPERAFWPWLLTMLSIGVGCLLTLYVPIAAQKNSHKPSVSMSAVERVWSSCIILLLVQGVGNYVLYLIMGYFSILHVLLLLVLLCIMIGVSYWRKLA